MFFTRLGRCAGRERTLVTANMSRRQRQQQQHHHHRPTTTIVVAVARAGHAMCSSDDAKPSSIYALRTTLHCQGCLIRRLGSADSGPGIDPFPAKPTCILTISNSFCFCLTRHIVNTDKGSTNRSPAKVHLTQLCIHKARTSRHTRP